MGKIRNKNHLMEIGNRLKEERENRQVEIIVCTGPGCLAKGSDRIAAALEKELADRDLTDEAVVHLTKAGCHGLCEKAPVVTIEPAGYFYQNVKPGDAAAIVEKTVIERKPVERLLYTDPDSEKKIEKYEEIPFYKRQMRIALRNVGRIDPLSIDDFIARGGYTAAAEVLSGKITPDEVIEVVEKSGLRGRGGGGFPTGRKWRSSKSAPGDVRYVICNGDEGDPGAFMDRAIMEGDPHSVIEGMIIGGYALETSYGYIYVRQEYPLAIKHLQKAIDQARDAGLLGENILGSGFSFDIRINRGGGAFVCGESSALMASIEGKVGEPRAKYIHSTERGLFDKPTVLNNVETWNNVPEIILKGADWFRSIGSEGSAGTKAFCLTGDIKNTGLIEVPMGTTLETIIEDIGGGVKEGEFKAVQTGGPSGGCIPESELDLPVDFDALSKAGSMMGSGGMIVMNDRTCMVDISKYFLKFLMDESCGKCVPCREGLRQMYYILSDISEGKGEKGDIERLETLGEAIQLGSLCALGKSGPNPVLSMIKYFRDEFEAHIEDKRCPGKVCKELITYRINDKCNGCTLCARVCPVNCISGEKNGMHVIDEDACIKCGSCVAACNFDAIDILS
jgi:NADH-quinone oxidoreductase subunit F